MSLIKTIEIPQDLWNGIYQTGSSVICNPPVIDTDIDYIIYTNEDIKLDTFLKCEGFIESCKDREEYDLTDEGFYCYRKENINLITTTSFPFYLKWVTATKLAKKLNLLNKEDRITLFQFVLYGNIETLPEANFTHDY